MYLREPPHEDVPHEQEHQRHLPPARLVRSGGDVDGRGADVKSDIVVWAVGGGAFLCFWVLGGMLRGVRSRHIHL